MSRRMLLFFSVALLGAGSTRALCKDILYVVSSPDHQLLTVDPVNGMTLRSIPITGAENKLRGLSLDGPTLWSIDGSFSDPSPKTFKIDYATGAGTAPGGPGVAVRDSSIENDPTTGTLYLITDQFEASPSELYTLDKETGIATHVAEISGPGLSHAEALAINANGTAYVTDYYNISLHKLNLATGQATSIGPLGIGPFWLRDLAFDGSGRLWGVTEFGTVYNVNITTGEATVAFQLSTQASGIAFGPYLPVCVKFCDFCDGIQVNYIGAGGAEWYHYDCAANSPMDVKVKQNGQWQSSCSEPPNSGKAIIRSVAPNGPGDWHFIFPKLPPFDANGTVDMLQGTYPNFTCWWDNLCYTFQQGACTGVNGQANRSSIQ